MPDDKKEPQDILQVWFAGVHCDVGGGYPEIESAESKYPLIWMIEEATKAGLNFNPRTVNQLAWGVQRKNSPFSYVPPGISCKAGKLHNSMTAAWRLLEYFPKSATYKEWPERKVLLGFYIPDFLVGRRRKKRAESIFLGLPDALDLMVVCVEAGLGLDAAMRRVTSELARTAPVLCEEFAIANFQMQMGRASRDVLRDLGIRTGVDDMRALAAVIIQAEKFGSSIGSALRVQSDAMRLRRRQLAEERAAKTAVKIMIPLILFIFPGVFVVLVGPAGIQLVAAFSQK